ncbi:MAG: hypothetical protein MK358_05310 [Vicinamibacterales bacterium]|nr:hypothetical protein [Vicinamibacterales bacterium]
MTNNQSDDACNDKSLLVSYLYDECDASARERAEAHFALCVSCRDEFEALTGVRGRLAEWMPPKPAPEFRIVPADAVAGRPGQPWTLWQSAPVWSLAAAVVFLIVASVANLEIRYGDDGVVVQTGWSNPTLPTEAVETAGDVAWYADLVALKAELRREFGASSADVSPQVATAVEPGLDAQPVPTHFQRLITESERRQQRDLALRFAHLTREAEAQRQADLLRIEERVGQIQGLTEAEVVQTNEIMDYLEAARRVSRRGVADRVDLLTDGSLRLLGYKRVTGR